MLPPWSKAPSSLMGRSQQPPNWKVIKCSGDEEQKAERPGWRRKQAVHTVQTLWRTPWARTTRGTKTLPTQPLFITLPTSINTQPRKKSSRFSKTSRKRLSTLSGQPVLVLDNNPRMQ